jgi:hypothetical protein
MKLLCLCLLCLIPQMAAFSQQDPKDPVFTVTYSNASPKKGDIIEVILKAPVPAGLYMYSTYNKCDIGPIKLELVFAQNKTYQLVGAPFSVGDKRATDEVFQCEVGKFEKYAEVHQKIKILATEVTINGTVEGQWCTETTCFNFGNITPVVFNSTLKASAPEAKKTKPAGKKSSSGTTKHLRNSAFFLKPVQASISKQA